MKNITTDHLGLLVLLGAAAYGFYKLNTTKVVFADKDKSVVAGVRG